MQCHPHEFGITVMKNTIRQMSIEIIRVKAQKLDRGLNKGITDQT